MKHTPGPWEAWNTADGVVLRHWRVGTRAKTNGIVTPIAVTANEDDGVAGDEQVGNAYLVAAAPDLLEACRAILKHSRDADMTSQPRKVTLTIPGSAWDSVLAAVSKAEGRNK